MSSSVSTFIALALLVPLATAVVVTDGSVTVEMTEKGQNLMRKDGSHSTPQWAKVKLPEAAGTFSGCVNDGGDTVKPKCTLSNLVECKCTRVSTSKEESTCCNKVDDTNLACVSTCV